MSQSPQRTRSWVLEDRPTGVKAAHTYARPDGNATGAIGEAAMFETWSDAVHFMESTDALRAFRPAIYAGRS